MTVSEMFPLDGETCIARAPLRISFGGGGTDLPAYYERRGGFVVSTAIDRFTFCLAHQDSSRKLRVRTADYGTMVEGPIDEDIGQSHALRLPRAALSWARDNGLLAEIRGLDLVLASEVRPGTGLGSSSAMAVSLVSALSGLSGRELTPEQCAEAACDIEINRVGLPIGKQDQYASAFGGVNALTFGNGVTVQPLCVSETVRQDLQRRMLLFSTGQTRDSSSILAEQTRHSAEKGTVIASLDRLKGIAVKMRSALMRGDLEAFGRLLDAAWKHKRKLSSRISSSQIDAWYEAAKDAGALGGKIAGAGGGGYMLIFCESSRVEDVRQTLVRLGLGHVKVRLCETGVARFLARDTTSDVRQNYLEFLGRGREEFISPRARQGLFA